MSPPETVCVTVPRGKRVSLLRSHTCPAANAQQLLRGALTKSAWGRHTHCARVRRMRKRGILGEGGNRSCCQGAEGGWRAGQKPRGTPQALWDLLVQPPASSPAPAAEASCPSSNILSARNDGLAHPAPRATGCLSYFPEANLTDPLPPAQEGPGYILRAPSASPSGC